MTATIEDIEEAAKQHNNAVVQLQCRANMIKRELDAVMKKHREEFNKQIEEAKETEATLTQLVENNPQLFVKPKSKVFHNIKVGYKKQSGKIVIKDEEKTIAKIEKLYDDPNGLLIKVSKSIVKKGVSKLPGDELKKLGITIEEATDKPFVTECEMEVDSLIELLMESK